MIDCKINSTKKIYKNHEIYFETAARVFLDDYRIDDYDELHSDFEERRKISVDFCATCK